MAAYPSRRLHARYPCKLKVRVFTARGREGVDGELLNVGMGGAFLRVSGTLDGGMLQLDVESGRERINLQAKMVRTAGKDPKDPKANFYGLQFQVNPRSEPQIRVMVDRVRSGGSVGYSMPVRDYWNL